MAQQYQNDLQLSIDKKVNEIVKQLPDFAGKFFRDLKSKGMSERTRLEYAYDMKRFFDFISNQSGFRNVSLNGLKAADVLDVLTYDDIQEYLDTLNTHTVIDKYSNQKEVLSSPSSRARKISSLRSFYRFYFRTGEIKNNLSDLMDLPKIPDKNIVTMEKSQVQRILAAVNDTAGMSEGEILRHSKIIKRDYAIMMLFFGTGIPASIIIIDKRGTKERKGVFFIDAKDGFMKDGAKNRLREQDIRRIVDVWRKKLTIPHYSRLATWEEVERNGFNLNIPRYIEAKDSEVKHNLDGHLRGGISDEEIDALEAEWKSFPEMKAKFFAPLRKGFFIDEGRCRGNHPDA